MEGIFFGTSLSFGCGAALGGGVGAGRNILSELFLLFFPGCYIALPRCTLGTIVQLCFIRRSILLAFVAECTIPK